MSRELREARNSAPLRPLCSTRSEARNHSTPVLVLKRWQPVVQPPRRTETSEAPRWQGATTENTGSI